MRPAIRYDSGRIIVYAEDESAGIIEIDDEAGYGTGAEVHYRRMIPWLQYEEEEYG